jgi:hypothetical protein
MVHLPSCAAASFRIVSKSLSPSKWMGVTPRDRTASRLSVDRTKAKIFILSKLLASISANTALPLYVLGLRISLQYDDDLHITGRTSDDYFAIAHSWRPPLNYLTTLLVGTNPDILWDVAHFHTYHQHVRTYIQVSSSYWANHHAQVEAERVCVCHACRIAA